jgi:acetyl esterase/lipase
VSLLAWALLVASLAACAGSGGGEGTTAEPTPTITSATGDGECRPGDRTSERDVAYREIAGVDPGLTSLDVYTFDDACDAPVVVWVHGGGYRTGDKANNVRDKVLLAREHGWVLVSVNYRLTRPGEPGSAQFPDHYDDVAAAFAWVHDHASEYGGDPSRLALLGHSAGADIVANVVTEPRYLEAHGLALRDVACAGPLDTEGFDKVNAGAGERRLWEAALGNNPRYATETSATLLVEPGVGIPPVIGVVRGTERRQRIERGFLDALRDAGIEATEIDARALSHQEVNTRIGAPGDDVMTPPLVAFLDTCFAR